MKSRFILFCLALQAVPAHAALVVAWDMDQVPNGQFDPASWDEDDHVTSSVLAAHGTVQKFGNNPGSYWGYSTVIDTNNYLGFTVTPEAGYQLSLTDLVSRPGSDDGSLGSYQWGYRINTGSGFGAWTLSPVNSITPGAKTWNFADFSTTGTVEFGFFANATDPSVVVKAAGPGPTGNELQLNGAVVTAVPEPSAAVLACLGALAAFRRRR